MKLPNITNNISTDRGILRSTQIWRNHIFKQLLISGIWRWSSFQNKLKNLENEEKMVVHKIKLKSKRIQATQQEKIAYAKGEHAL